MSQIHHFLKIFTCQGEGFVVRVKIQHQGDDEFFVKGITTVISNQGDEIFVRVMMNWSIDNDGRLPAYGHNIG